jgi:hypothetical protein
LVIFNPLNYYAFEGLGLSLIFIWVLLKIELFRKFPCIEICRRWRNVETDSRFKVWLYNIHYNFILKAHSFTSFFQSLLILSIHLRTFLKTWVSPNLIVFGTSLWILTFHEWFFDFLVIIQNFFLQYLQLLLYLGNVLIFLTNAFIFFLQNFINLLNLQFQHLIFFNQFLVFCWLKWYLLGFFKIWLFMQCWSWLILEKIFTSLFMVNFLIFFIWIRILVDVKVFIFDFCYISKVWT